jgi:flagellar basal body-associated protein FliL
VTPYSSWYPRARARSPQTASKYQKKYRCWLLVILLIIVMVAIGMTCFFFLKK